MDTSRTFPSTHGGGFPEALANRQTQLAQRLSGTLTSLSSFPVVRVHVVDRQGR